MLSTIIWKALNCERIIVAPDQKFVPREDTTIICPEYMGRMIMVARDTDPDGLGLIGWQFNLNNMEFEQNGMVFEPGKEYSFQELPGQKIQICGYVTNDDYINVPWEYFMKYFMK